MSEDFRRPDHNDFKDSSELRKEKFTGLRHNSLSREWEIWTEGDLRARGPEENQKDLMKAWAEVFALDSPVSFKEIPKQKGEG